MADDFNPYSAPQTTTQPIVVEEGGGLKNLGQEARLKNLNLGRWAMIVIGLYYLGINLYEFFNADEVLAKALRQAGHVPNPVMIQMIKEQVYPFIFALISIGIALVLLGIFIYASPFIFSILGFVLYLGAIGIMGYLDPLLLFNGWLIKLGCIAILVQAIAAAKAYEQERRMSAYDGF